MAWSGSCSGASLHFLCSLIYFQCLQDESEYQARVMAALEEEDEDKLIEERRKRRQEILAKFGQNEAHEENPEEMVDQQEEAAFEAMETDAIAQIESNGNGEADIWQERRERMDVGNGSAQIDESGIGEKLGGEAEKRLDAVAKVHDAQVEDSDVDDIFADTPEEKLANIAVQAVETAQRRALVDSYDDAEGYYNFQVGEMIGSRYKVFATLGRGVFSSVLQARDMKSGEGVDDAPQVAVKVIRANDTMYKAGQMERVILNKLSQSDPEGRKHCIRMLHSFEYRNHLCLVFEPMDMDLRGLTKRYGRGIGLSINAVRIYAMQMLVALQHLRNCGVLHADIKPDNILVNERRTVIKICDFGSAMFSGDNEITPYLVSRFYRAPEVILGLPYDHPMDMWSIGCVIYELFTGQILFPGRTNNEMLKLMMEVKGPFPKKMLKKAEFAFKHFESDPNMSFALQEEDPVTRQQVRRIIANPTKTRDFATRLQGQVADRRKISQLIDLLERMMALDPDKRITPRDALKHAFIKESAQAIKVAPRTVMQQGKRP